MRQTTKNPPGQGTGTSAAVPPLLAALRSPLKVPVTGKPGADYSVFTRTTPEGTSSIFCQVPLSVSGGTSLLGPDGLLSSFAVDRLIIRFWRGLSSGAQKKC